MMRICFVCQSGALEPKAILLAASLRLHFPTEIELIAAHPASAGPLLPETQQALAALRVAIVPIRNPMRADYPIGHKLAALMLLGGPDLGILVDTDILAMARPEPLSDVVSAVPASFNHHTKPVWEHVYDSFGVTFPRLSPPTLVSGNRTAPYFNSGMIVVPGRVAGWLAASWIDTAARIDDDPEVPSSSKRPNLSQLALPVAAARLGIDIEVLDSRWNFPGWSWRIEDHGEPILFHYQSLQRLREEEAPLRSAMQAADLFPSVRNALVPFLQV
jgi:hypothetical protein